MSLFLKQRRVLFNSPLAVPVSYPTDVTATIILAPEDAFGVDGAANRRFFPLGPLPRASLNANVGEALHEGGLLDQPELALLSQGIDMTLKGNRLALRYRARSHRETLRVADSMLELLPPLLRLRIGAYVWIKQFLLNIGGAQFYYGVGRVASSFRGETTERIKNAVENTLRDWGTMVRGHQRLVSGVYYYRHARRISELQPDRLALVPEVLLNLNKALEVLFTSKRETVRKRGRAWGLTEQQIEQWIIPIMLLRNEMDVAHIALEPLSVEERDLVLSFAGMALERVGTILTSILEGVMNGSIALDPITGSPSSDRKKLLSAVAKYIAAPGSS